MDYKILIVLLCISSAWCDTPKIQVCDDDASVDISTGVYEPNGEILYQNYYYQNHEYYFDESGKERSCKVCSKVACIRKCCPIGFGYNMGKKGCENMTDLFDPPIWLNLTHEIDEDVDASQLPYFIPGKLNRTAPSVGRFPGGTANDTYHLEMDGKLIIQSNNTNQKAWGPKDYCIDIFVYGYAREGVRTINLGALIYIEKEEQDYTFSISCMIISCVFLLATCAVYALLPELWNLHSMVLIAYLLCLFVTFAFLATMEIMMTLNNISKTACITLTFIIYYSLLAAFFWLNVMCFDIWWKFSGKGGLSLKKLSIRGKFLAYSAYAFGFPTALTILLAGLQFSGLPSHPLLPMIGDQGCFIDGTSKLFYMYGPIMVLCVANMVFFILTAMKITQIKKQTSVLKSKESSMHDRHRNDKQRLLLNLKLFAVMGLNWILEVISALLPDAKELWLFTDAYNMLIGVIIFIIFVCKRNVFILIKKRYKELRGDPIPSSQTITSHRNSCSRVQRGSVTSR